VTSLTTRLAALAADSWRRLQDHVPTPRPAEPDETLAPEPPAAPAEPDAPEEPDGDDDLLDSLGFSPEPD
jgi:hypothetical protein